MTPKDGKGRSTCGKTKPPNTEIHGFDTIPKRRANQEDSDRPNPIVHER
jgi:hypothetical protein